MFLHAARRNVCSTFRNSNIRKFLRTFQEWHYARALHSRKHDHEVQLYAFDILALDGEDLRRLPLSMRKTNLARLLARRPDGIFVAPFEQGEIGLDLFRAACRLGLEGLVSKRRGRPYQAGRSKHWVKVKNRSHPAMSRVMDSFA
jgi:bifunctional non-homologous end joining protein LigD